MGDCPEQGILHFIDVLVFINHDLIEALGNLPRCRRPLSVLLQEQTDCQVLQITVVKEALLPFFLLISLRKVQRQPLQVTEQRIGAAQFLLACLAV